MSSLLSNVYFESGVTALVAEGTGFVGDDVNLLVVPWTNYYTQSTLTAPTFHLELGVTF